MALKSGERQSTSKIEQGIHEAVFVGVWDLGEQLMAGQFPGLKHRCLIMWELIGGDTISKEYTFFQFLPPKSVLRQDLESWVCKGLFTDEMLKNIEYQKLLGKHCQVLVMNNDKGYPKVNSVLPAKDVSWEAHNKLVYYEIGDQIPEGTPNWVISKIKGSKELTIPAGGSQGAVGGEEVQGHHGNEEEVPF